MVLVDYGDYLFLMLIFKGEKVESEEFLGNGENKEKMNDILFYYLSKFKFFKYRLFRKLLIVFDKVIGKYVVFCVII